MEISLKKVIEDLPKGSQQRIKKKTLELVKEYKSLQEIRKALGLTQAQLAGELSMSQVNISKLENRKDFHLSTLRKYVEALGCELHIHITAPDKSIVEVKNL